MKKVLIICRMDGFANSVRPRKIRGLLEKNNFNVDLFDTISMCLVGKDFKPKKKDKFKETIMNFFKKYFLNILIEPYLKINSHKILKYLKDKNYNAIICETAMDSYFFMENLNTIKILDLPAPLIDELYYGRLISKHKYKKLLKRDKELFGKVDFLSFHWHNYADYVKKSFYNGKNFIELNWGCEAKESSKLAKFSKRPKVIFLGYLEGYWNNLPLLSKLSKIYDIDVYGGPKPEEKWKLNYKGYAPDLNLLSKYQFGLITITKDKLRKSSFSSKHLEYLSWGLPVLTPEWRKDKILDDVSIYYNEKNFLKKIKEFSKKKGWEEISKKSYKKAKELNWEKNLQPLIKFLKDKIR